MNAGLPVPTTEASLRARLAASADAWTRKLLDLTKRNRALNFKPTKVSNVAVVNELPAEIFRKLYLREQKMRFKPAPEPDLFAGSGRARVAESVAGAGDADIADDTDVYEDVGVDFAPYDSAALASAHTDEWLQTTVPRIALETSLRRIDEQSRLMLEEQGVNTLFLALGMLHYTESSDSAVTLRAPLVLLPVELTRASVRAGYVVVATDDDPQVNPALTEYLRQQHGIALPALPESGNIPDDYDLQTVYAAISATINGREGWSIKTDVYLGLFSFQKFVMYKDLESNVDALTSHPLVRLLVSRRPDQGGPITGLPSDVREMDLDASYPPESTSLVVDADSSQLRAIAATAKGYSVVIEGPPGTGKSQTITNIIGAALSAGKSVLFVAEKMAALQVVHRRLTESGLGAFCLELHSSNGNKRTVMNELKAALDASLQGVASPTGATYRLPKVRSTLSDYAQAVHAPFGALNTSPFRAYGELDRVLAAPRVALTGTVETVTVEALGQATRELEELAAAAGGLGPPGEHPWRDTGRTFYTTDARDDVAQSALAVVTAIADVQRRATEVHETFALPPVRTLADVETAATLAEIMHRSPGAPLEVLGSAAWNAPPPAAERLIAHGRAVTELARSVGEKVVDAALAHDHAADIAFVETKSRGVLRFIAFLDGRYRAIKRQWAAYRQPGYAPSLVEQAYEMKRVDRLRVDRQALHASREEGRSLFGALWNGEQSEWAALQQYIAWVVSFRQACVQHGLTGRALEVAARPAPDLSAVEGMRASAQHAAAMLVALGTLVEWPDNYLASAPLSEISERAQAIADSTALASRWAAFEAARRTVAGGLGAELLPAIMAGTLPCAYLPAAFLRAFWLKWLTAVVTSRPLLALFDGMQHEQRVAEFRELDKRVLLENRSALIGTIRDRVQHALRTEPAASGMPVLRKEMARQRGHAPLRKTLRSAEHAIRAIKPCFLMSPLTVAKYLNGSAPTFDVVVFDEASQLPAEDAVGAIIRGKQLVVVGDPKQLPPTNFFTAQGSAVPTAVADDGTPLFEDSESILEEYMGAGMPMSRLKWHYRSAHESLIHFSNVSFYDADLYSFPSVDTSTTVSGLQFEFVGGVYEGKGLNAIEARRVADEVVRFAKEQIQRRDRGEAVQTLGVGTFNMRQQLAIQDELEQRRRDHPDIESFFDRGVAEPFFVKNLENIQGDERDVIFLSVTYAKAADGRLRYTFGPLNGENGWRRLNVITTRARQRMTVFSSMRGDEISAVDTTSKGARLLREFLTYAETGRLESTHASLAADTESPFELAVLGELTRRGVTVVPQVGVAGYRIDLGVLDATSPGRFICGIECDGVSYHSSETARDRDRLRQQVLEARGWIIHRVWSTDWFKDRAGQIERLMAKIEQSRMRGQEQSVARRGAQAARDVQALQEASESTTGATSASPPNADSGVLYVRPVAAPYVSATGDPRQNGRDLLVAPISDIALAVHKVISIESPVHQEQLIARIVGMWGTKAGSRIRARIEEACRAVERDGGVRRRGVFLWGQRDDVTVRSRAEVRMAAEHIPPEEYDGALKAVLAGGHGFSREQLTNEIRAVLGFGRTGQALEEAITASIERALASGTIGESSMGVGLRV